jgi:radical SAM superfamily enzyme YgiQ (UPF0313 family)
MSGEFRRGRRVALLARYPEPDPAMPQRIPNLGLRMVEASLRAVGFSDLELRVWDLDPAAARDPQALAAEIAAFDPDIVGISVFLWSFPFFLEVAHHLKTADPARLIVFGGPSARPVMLDQPPHRARASAVDVLVINEGEETFREIVALGHRSAAELSRLPGVAVRSAAGWHETPARPLGDLNLLPSPYEMKLIPPGGLSILQTYRGCPFTCSFCEWGTLESPKRVRSVGHLATEFDAIAGLGIGAALLADAGLNLNAAAFHNLRAAAAETGFFASRGLICEVYPAMVRRDHLDFLYTVGDAYVGVGLQSFDSDVLAQVDRRYDEARFAQTLQALGEVAHVAVEIIMGLPGDTRDNFRRNFERARRLPCTLRVYYCVVLPSALMVRAPPEQAIAYDAISLKMQSCLGWPPGTIADEADFLAREAERSGGQAGEFFWIFPPP